MKRIERGPVRGISLRLQEEVSTLQLFLPFNFFIFNFRIGKRKKDGFHPRKIRDPNLKHRRQGPSCQGSHQRARNQVTCQATQARQKEKLSEILQIMKEKKFENQAN